MMTISVEWRDKGEKEKVHIIRRGTLDLLENLCS